MAAEPITDAARHAPSEDATARRIKRYLWIAAGAWTAIVLASLAVNHALERRWLRDTAFIEAQIAIDKDVVYRKWNAGHGGVYVPVSAETPPNPYLAHVPGRDVTTASGLTLTLVNPAYMTRQVHEFEKGKGRYDVRGHLTSLRAINPQNAPDGWERSALARFDKGAREESGFGDIEGKPYFRLMRAFVTEKPCLRCHEIHGFKEGEIRGGISVSVPMEPLSALSGTRVLVMSMGHLLALCAGLAGIAFAGRRVLGAERVRTAVELSLRETEARYRALFEGSTDMVYLCDFEGNFIDANDAALAILGYRREEIGGLNFAAVLDPGEIPVAIAALAELSSTGRQVKPLELHLLTRTGDIRIVESNASVVHLAGRPAIVQGIVRDLTEQVRAAQALTVEHEKLQRVVGELKDALAKVKTLSGVIPICMHCKKIRDDTGYWNKLESFIQEHSETKGFSHGICPECLAKHYPDHE